MPEPDQEAAVGETPAGVPPAAEPKETTQPALAPEVSAPAEAAPTEPYKAGDIMREERRLRSRSTA